MTTLSYQMGAPLHDPIHALLTLCPDRTQIGACSRARRRLRVPYKGRGRSGRQEF